MWHGRGKSQQGPPTGADDKLVFRSKGLNAVDQAEILDEEPEGEVMWSLEKVHTDTRHTQFSNDTPCKKTVKLYTIVLA